MILSIFKHVTKCLFGLALLSPSMEMSRLLAQGATATMLGTITDMSGASVPNAVVQVRNVATTAGQTVNSDPQGRYRVSDIGIGEYEIQVSSGGFSTVIRKGITLTVGSQVIVDVALAVGQQTETVTVDAAVTQVETTNSSVGSLVNQQQMRELPLNGRNFQQLILLAPGVQSVAVQGGARAGREPGFSAAGARPEGQSILLDDEPLENFYRRGVGTVLALRWV